MQAYLRASLFGRHKSRTILLVDIRRIGGSDGRRRHTLGGQSPRSQIVLIDEIRVLIS